VVAGVAIVALAACRPTTAVRPRASADSALVARILAAEDRRDLRDSSLALGAAREDSLTHWLAWRAAARIRDPLFAARDSLPRLTAPPVWPEPAWRSRYRQLTRTSDCAVLRSALADSVWPVRLRAADLLSPACANDDRIVATLRAWLNAPRNAERHARGEPSWHAAAHAAVALAALSPAEARAPVQRFLPDPRWEARLYAARAAAKLVDAGRTTADSAMLEQFARDPDDNVAEFAITALAARTGHLHDDLYLEAIESDGPPRVIAAAHALKGSPRPDARARLGAAFDRWVSRRNASERDVRVALLDAAGRSPSDDRPPAPRTDLPRDAVALAMGAERRLRVTLSQESGGGSFVVRLRGDIAPIMAARVLDLARAGYYDGGHWHRVEHDFVIQGAGPGTNEYVGYKDYLRDELGNVPHVRGTVGMSTRGHDTGDAQWFVNLKDNLRLNRDYTVFAEVVEGMDVVDDILEGDVIATVRLER
jgi:cyclophilin family peptidyl-prolyl cis-trans isomerase